MGAPLHIAAYENVCPTGLCISFKVASPPPYSPKGVWFIGEAVEEKEFYSGAGAPVGCVRGEFLLPLRFLYRGSKMKKQELLLSPPDDISKNTAFFALRTTRSAYPEPTSQ
ncbi:MAG: hypothetical protein EBU93_07225 [Chlamydiae bacterium]|nr:hypothetical protein [Chlamydiota bacterium]